MNLWIKLLLELLLIAVIISIICNIYDFKFGYGKNGKIINKRKHL